MKSFTTYILVICSLLASVACGEAVHAVAEPQLRVGAERVEEYVDALR